MGNEASKERVVEGNLPIVNKLYKIVSILGEGHFGSVYKVQEKKTKKFFAMKCIPVVRDGKKEDVDKPDSHFKTALNEVELLKHMDHGHIVRIHDSFRVMKKPGEKKGKKEPWFCIVLEYIKGDTLEGILRKLEVKKNEKKRAIRTSEPNLLKLKSSGGQNLSVPKKGKRARSLVTLIGLSKKNKGNESHQENQVSVEDYPKSLIFRWFLKLLDTVIYIHKKNIIHADLHCENVLLGYDNINDFDNIVLKISDFGCAKVIKEGEELPRDLAGQIYYAPFEAINQHQYDTRLDMWSLGLIFLNLFAEMSMKSYIRTIQRYFIKIKTDRFLRMELMKRYQIEETIAVDRVPVISLINFMHEHNMYEDNLIPDLVDDGGVRFVLNNMMTSYKRRFYATDLRDTNVVKTWAFLLDKSGKIKIEKEDLDVLGLISIMRLKEDMYFSRCMKVLKDHFLRLNPLLFVKNGGIQVILERMNLLHEKIENLNARGGGGQSRQDNKKKKKKKRDNNNNSLLSTNLKIQQLKLQLNEIVSMSVKVLCYLLNEKEDSSFDRTLNTMQKSLRMYDCLPSLRSLIMNDKDPKSMEEYYFYFIYLMVEQSPSIGHAFCNEEVLSNICSKMIDERKIRYIYGILTLLMPLMKKRHLQVLVTSFKGDDFRFFKNCRYTMSVYQTVLPGLFKQLEKEVVVDDNDKQKMISLLSTIIFMIQNFNQEHRINEWQRVIIPVKEFKPGDLDIRVAMGYSKYENGVVLDVPSHRFECITKDTNPVEIVTKKPLRKITTVSDGRKEMEWCVVYFEVIVESGGFLDDFQIGYHSIGNKACFAFFRVAEGVVEICEVGKNQKHDSKETTLGRKGEFLCFSGTHVGCGVTNKGRVFWTLDNTLIPKNGIPIQFLPKRRRDYNNIPIGLKPSVKVAGNLGFRGKFIFFGIDPHPPFKFNFKNDGKKNTDDDDCEDYLCVSDRVLEFIRNETNGNEVIGKVCEKYKNTDQNGLTFKLVKKIEGLLLNNKEEKNNKKKIDDDDELNETLKKNYLRVEEEYNNRKKIKAMIVTSEFWVKELVEGKDSEEVKYNDNNIKKEEEEENEGESDDDKNNNKNKEKPVYFFQKKKKKEKKKIKKKKEKKKKKNKKKKNKKKNPFFSSKSLADDFTKLAEIHPGLNVNEDGEVVVMMEEEEEEDKKKKKKDDKDVMLDNNNNSKETIIKVRDEKKEVEEDSEKNKDEDINKIVDTKKEEEEENKVLEFVWDKGTGKDDDDDDDEEEEEEEENKVLEFVWDRGNNKEQSEEEEESEEVEEKDEKKKKEEKDVALAFVWDKGMNNNNNEDDEDEDEDDEKEKEKKDEGVVDFMWDKGKEKNKKEEEDDDDENENNEKEKVKEKDEGVDFMWEKGTTTTKDKNTITEKKKKKIKNIMDDSEEELEEELEKSKESSDEGESSEEEEGESSKEEEEGESSSEESESSEEEEEVKKGRVLYSYNYEDVSVEENQRLTVLSGDVNGYTYVEIEKTSEKCYIPTKYFEVLNDDDDDKEETEEEEKMEEKKQVLNIIMKEDGDKEEEEKKKESDWRKKMRERREKKKEEREKMENLWIQKKKKKKDILVKSDSSKKKKKTIDM